MKQFSLLTLCVPNLKVFLVLFTILAFNANAQVKQKLVSDPECVTHNSCSTALDQENNDRYKKDIETFSRIDEICPPRGNGIVCVGSSSMRMWAWAMHKELYPLSVIPRGFGGSQYSDVLDHFDALITKYRPRAVLVYEGENDLNVGKTVSEVFCDYKKLIHQIHLFDPSIRIYSIGIKPTPKRWSDWNRHESLNRLIEEFCSVHSNAFFIDLPKGFLASRTEPDPSFYQEDGIHLTQNGYQVWSEVIREVLLKNEIKYEAPLKRDS